MTDRAQERCGGSGEFVEPPSDFDRRVGESRRWVTPCPGCPDCRPCERCKAGSSGVIRQRDCPRCHGTGVEPVPPPRYEITASGGLLDHAPPPDGSQERWTIYVCDEGHVQTEPYRRGNETLCRHGLSLSDFVPAYSIEVVPASKLQAAEQRIASLEAEVEREREWRHDITHRAERGEISGWKGRAESAEARLQEALAAAELAQEWFDNFHAKPPHEGIDLTGADTVSRKLRSTLARLRPEGEDE